MMITTEGIIIRLECKDITILGRITSGVKLMDLKDGVTVASIAKVREKKEEAQETEQPKEQQNQETDSSQDSETEENNGEDRE